MKKFISVTFAISLVIWFLAAIYLSINFLIGLFINVNPTISKNILAGSFLWLIILGIYNKYNGGDFTQVSSDLTKIKDSRLDKKSGCKSCKQK